MRFAVQVPRIGADGLLQQFLKLASVDLVSVTVGSGLLSAVNALGLGQARVRCARDLCACVRFAQHCRMIVMERRRSSDPK